MTTDYIVSSLPPLAFNAKAPISWAKFCEACGGEMRPSARWIDLDAQLRNAMAAARGFPNQSRPVNGCSLYWQKRVIDCFAEKNVLKRDEMLDRTWWDAAGELADISAPLGAGALETYAIRLKIAIKRSRISVTAGNEAFDRLMSEAHATSEPLNP